MANNDLIPHALRAAMAAGLLGVVACNSNAAGQDKAPKTVAGEQTPVAPPDKPKPSPTPDKANQRRARAPWTLATLEGASLSGGDKIHLTPSEAATLGRAKPGECPARLEANKVENVSGHELQGRRRKGSYVRWSFDLDETESKKRETAGERAYCVYLVKSEKVRGRGRPVIAENGDALVAPTRVGMAWSPDLTPVLPEDEGIRAELAAGWLADAQLEHSSVAEFARVATELMGMAAPPGLLAGVFDAARDELVHAELCYGLASAYLGRHVGPGPLQGPSSRDLSAIEMARLTLREACIEETLAAFQAHHLVTTTNDPAVKDVLETIANDEERHAALGWQILSWLLSESAAPEEMREALIAEFRIHTAAGSSPESTKDDLVLWGRANTTTAAGLDQRAFETVVRPLFEQVVLGS